MVPLKATVFTQKASPHAILFTERLIDFSCEKEVKRKVVINIIVSKNEINVSIIQHGELSNKRNTWNRLQQSTDPFNNKFITHHEILVQELRQLENKQISDCWICTHSPVSAASMPFLAVPITLEEILNWPNCSDTLANNATKFSRLWNTTVGIPVVGWVDLPWWQGNLTATSKYLQFLALNGNKWVPRNKSSLTNLGFILTEGLQISFNATSSTADAFKLSLLERYIHNHSWVHANLFIKGTNDTCFKISGNIPCNESSEYKPSDPTCGNPNVGYCSPLGQMPSWCMLSNNTVFINLVHNLVLQHSALWDLPSATYWVCGNNAYKWLPVGVGGTCMLARLTPATYLIPHSKVDMRAIPLHTIYKRAKDHTPHPSGRPHLVQMSIPNKIASTVFLYPMVTQMWDKLVEVADYLDDQIWNILEVINTIVAVQNQLIIVASQHTLVLDYLTAAQGGMCQVIGPACCHYIDPDSTIRLKTKMEDIRKLKEEYNKHNELTKDNWWSDTFSFLNPANWFKGIGGWIAGILQGVLHIAACILLIYVLLKLVFYSPLIIQRFTVIVITVIIGAQNLDSLSACLPYQYGNPK
ncbi:uncharacterized protein [Phyllobates terribilis]|uniref:uncharacterized protein n=1 Tax=Phyllobates terribilis TaxID=111132 RepID=UPI003CCAC8D7